MISEVPSNPQLTLQMVPKFDTKVLVFNQTYTIAHKITGNVITFEYSEVQNIQFPLRLCDFGVVYSN